MTCRWHRACRSCRVTEFSTYGQWTIMAKQ